MERLYFLPQWFIMYGLGLELVFAIITFLVALYAYKVYKLTSQKEHKLFSLGFLLVSFSYICWFILNLFALIELNDNLLTLEIGNAVKLINLGAYLHILFSLLGLIFLVYTSLKVKRAGIFVLISSLTIFSILLTDRKALMFYFLSSILVLYLVAHYFLEYRKKKNIRLIVMSSAFFFLFLGTFELIFTSRYSEDYVVGHIFILISYLIILLNLASVFKNGQKKQ